MTSPHSHQKTMKILALHDIEAQLPAVDAIPDSAILRDGKPFFIPRWSEQWHYRPMPAFRVGRLGKNIARRFAMRYIDAITLSLRVYPTDCIDSLRGLDIPKGTLTSFDGSVILGEWSALPSDPSAPLTVAINGLTIEAAGIFDRLTSAIETLSKYFTLKMGDIIIPPMPASPEIPMKIDTATVGSIDNIEVLKFNIK